MGLLQKMGTGQGFVKAGFLGFAGAGKTWTSTLLAIGIRKHFKLDGPVALFDTEGGSEFVAPMVKDDTGKDLVGIRSRSFDDVIALTKEAIESGVSVLIVDSVTHIWRELCDAYLRQINEKRARTGMNPRTRLEFQDWNHIKGAWAKWTDLYLNSPLHIIIAGRAGFEWDFEETTDDSGNVKKELIKTGIKMKTETEFGFEPSLLVEMERVQLMEDKKLTKRFVRRATVLKDRFGVIDGQSFDNPTFESFLPHVAALTPGAHAPVDTGVKSDLGVDDQGDADWQRERRQRTILCEEIQGEIVNTFPSQKAEDKKAKADLLHKVFRTRSWTKVENLDSETLRKGLDKIRKLVKAANEEAA